MADILRQYGPDYRVSHNLPRKQLRSMHAIEVCRTAALGGHVDKCDCCGHLRISYNSCRNRHCPKCQFLRKDRWIQDRTQDLLPIPYFHVVFTIPSELNPVVLRNQTVMYDLLFRSVSETLMHLAKDRLGAHIGFICILHTWGQNLMEHPHIHCVVTGGGLSPEENRWVSCRKQFFLPVRVMSSLFRGKFLHYLKRIYESGQLLFPGIISTLAPSHAFRVFRRRLYHTKWVVYCKPPFNGPRGVLKYLGRYTHRIAISNDRILKVHNGRVSFLWRDYADGKKKKVMTLDVFEFIRRFLLHVLPDRFVKIRHYGLLANRKRRDTIAFCRQILGSGCIDMKNKEMTVSWQQRLLMLSGIDVTKCPVCQKGGMIRVEVLHPARTFSATVRCNSPPVIYS